MATKNGGDERMARPDAPHDGGFREGDDVGEQYKSLHDKAYDLVDYERRRKLREQWDERILPDLPDSKAMHRCWVSTTHPIDTPQRRKRFGYRFVPMEDVREQGWSADITAVKDGQFAGCVQWRELVAMEIPRQTHVDYMTIYHFDMPQEQAQGIIENLDALNEQVRGKGGRIDMEEAMLEMKRRIKMPPTRMFE
jgi:hypothetical protein